MGASVSLRLSSSTQNGIEPQRQLPVQEQLRTTHQEGVQTQEVIHTVSPPRLYPGWVNIGWKTGVRIAWKSTNRVLPVSEDVMFKWRLLVEEGRKVGHTFPQPDLIIAATAMHHGLTIVSRDEGGYAKTGALLINPWQQERRDI